MGGCKFDQGKLRFDLLPPVSLAEIAAVLTFGAGKYGDRNWEQGVDHGRLFGAIQRHLWAWWSGENYDPESGLSHLSHACCTLIMLMEMRRLRPDLDQRSQMGPPWVLLSQDLMAIVSQAIEEGREKWNS